MDDFVRINQPRVEKILGILDTIDKSARSNKVHDGFEHAALLRPIWERIDKVGCALIDPPAPIVPRTPQRQDIEIADAARNAPLRDLLGAMAVMLNRIDELLAE